MINPTTNVDPDTDRFAIVRISTGQIININAAWPVLDGGPIVGGNPDLAYYVRREASNPDVDHRYTIQTEWQLQAYAPEPPEGHPAGQYLQVKTPMKLPAEELKRQVESYFQDLISQLFPAGNDTAKIIEVASALSRKSRGSVLTSGQTALLAEFEALGDTVEQNRARMDELFAAIDGDADYDIEEGWTAPTPLP